MLEQHLDLLALALGGQPLVLFGDGAGEVTCAFMDGARHLAGLHTGAASRLERAGHSYVLPFFAKQPACLIGIEACAMAHHWARELCLGHEVH